MRILSLVIGAMAGLSIPATQAGVVQQLIGATRAGILYDIDRDTGLASNPRDTGLGTIFGLAFDSSSGNLYGLSGASSGDIYRIDSNSGATESTPWHLSGRVWNSLAFDSSLGVFYANGSFPGGLGNFVSAFTPSTGTAVDFPFLSGSRAPLVVDENGSLFLFSFGARNILELNANDGSIISNHALRDTYSFPVTLAIDAENHFFTSDYVSIGGINTIYRLDLLTGGRQILGFTGISGSPIEHMVFIPEPCTTALFLLALIAIVKFRERSRETNSASTRHFPLPNDTS